MSDPIINVQVSAAAVISAWNRRDAQGLLQLYAPDCKVEDIGLAKPVYGHDGVRRVYLYTIAGFSELEFTLLRSIESETEIVMEWACHGTQVRRILRCAADRAPAAHDRGDLVYLTRRTDRELTPHLGHGWVATPDGTVARFAADLTQKLKRQVESGREAAGPKPGRLPAAFHLAFCDHVACMTDRR